MNEQSGAMFEPLRSLFQKAVNQHRIHLETEGEDPEWPLWYADYLMAELGKVLNATFTKSELIYLLILVERQRALQAPGSDWATYYARFFSERYA